MQHDWKLASSDPCAPVGPGRINATFEGTGKGSFKVIRFGGGLTYEYNPGMTLRGSITETDETTQNPNDTDSPCRPTDKSGCGTRKLKESHGFLQDNTGGIRLAFEATGVGNAFSAGDCQESGFNDFGRIDGRTGPNLYVPVPKPAKLARKRKSFSVSAERRDSGQRGGGEQRRSVTVKFTRQR